MKPPSPIFPLHRLTPRHLRPRQLSQLGWNSGARLRTFALDFTSGNFPTHFGGQLLSFSRASAATRWNADRQLELVGNDVPRIDHDPVTGARLGYLAESQKVNSEQRYKVNGVGWQAVGGGTNSFNSLTSPLGLLDATLVETTTSSGYIRNTARNMGSGQVVTVSVMFKQIGASDYAVFRLQEAFPTRIDVRYRYSTGEVVYSTTSGGANGAITNVQAPLVTLLPNGWINLSISFTTPSAGTGGITLYYRAKNSASDVDTGDTGGNSSGGIYGVQYELGGASSGIISDGSATTRQADTLTVPTAGWFNPLEGTFIVDAVMYPGSVTNLARSRDIIIVGDGNNRLILRASNGPNDYPVGLIGNGSTFAIANVGTSVANVEKIGLTYSTTETGVFARNGATSIIGGLFSGVNPTSMFIGSNLDGYIRKITYLPKLSTAAQLVALTTP